MTHYNPIAVFEDAFAGSFEVLELEDASIVHRKILLGVPWRMAEGLETAVLLESDFGLRVFRSIPFIRKLKVLFILCFQSLPLSSIQKEEKGVNSYTL